MTTNDHQDVRAAIADEALRRAGLEHIDATPDAIEGEILRRLQSDALYNWRPNPSGDQGPFFRAVTAAALARASGTYIALGGNRAGKTDLGAATVAYIIRHILAPIARERNARGEPTHAWCVAPTYEQAGQILWKAKLRRLIPATLIRSISWSNKAREHPHSVTLKSGLEIVFKSADQDREAFQGDAIHLLWIDEQAPDDIIEEATFRCIDYAAPIIRTLTPIEPDPTLQDAWEEQPDSYHWFNLDIDDNRQSRGGHLPDLEVDITLAKLRAQNPDLYETRKSGAFAGLTGSIFKPWSRDLHVRPRAQVDAVIRARRESLTFALGIDFGISNPTCVLWGAHDPDTDTWFIFAEHYEAQRTIEYHHVQITRIQAEYDHPKLLLAAADPGDMVSTQAKPDDFRRSAREYLRKQGMPIVNAAKRRWWPTVETTLEYMAPEVMADAKGHIVYGNPRLVVSDRCTQLIREIPIYRYAKKTTEERDPKDGVPVKLRDHAVDALRYLLHTARVHSTMTPTVPDRFKRDRPASRSDR